MFVKDVIAISMPCKILGVVNEDLMKINICRTADVYGEVLPNLPLWMSCHWLQD